MRIQFKAKEEQFFVTPDELKVKFDCGDWTTNPFCNGEKYKVTTVREIHYKDGRRDVIIHYELEILSIYHNPDNAVLMDTTQQVINFLKLGAGYDK
ncbi:MAG: hypothetical protein ACW96U_00750 [Candidatus Heimdallarchaeaceae archaeon]|jgi:hypothetical protein